MDTLVAFYRGERADAAGRHLDDIWEWSPAKLEETHDYIQWLFPLDQPSHVNPAAPIVTAETRRAFEWDDTMRDRLMRSFWLMLGFYGLEHRDTPDGPIVTRGAAFAERSKVWLQPGNHNYLRLSRIMKSMRLLGLEFEAAALYACLESIRQDEGRTTIGADTAKFWRDAAGAL
jgi:hypothetical protein